jgi:hypothetical protein
MTRPTHAMSPVATRLLMWLGAILLAALFLHTRTADIAIRPLWTDEVGQAWVSGAATLTEMHERALAWDRHPPGYSFLLRPFAGPGSSELTLRILSFAAGLLTIAATWGMARAWLPHWECGCTTLLVGASPSVALYSREARPYALALLALVMFFWALGKHWHRATRASTAGLVLSAAAATLLSYSSAVVVAIALATTLFCAWTTKPKVKNRTAGFLLAIGAVAIAAAWLIKTYLTRYSVAETSSMYLAEMPSAGSPLSLATHLLTETVQLLAYFCLGHVYGPMWSLAALAAGGLLTLLVAFGVITLWKQRGQSRVLAATLLAALAGFMVLAIARLHPYGDGRHCLVLAPPLFMIAAAGLGAIRHKLPRFSNTMVAGLMLFGFASSLSSATPNYMVEDLPAVLRRIQQRWHPGDSLVVPEPSVRSFEHYKKPCGVDRLPTVFLQIPPPQLEAQLRSHDPRPGARSWTVFVHCKPHEIKAVEDYFATTADRVDTVVADGASATCWKMR